MSWPKFLKFKSPDQKVESRIAEARKSASKQLHLNGFGLTSLPDSIGQLSALQELYISGNQLVNLPTSFGQLTALRRIDLSRNQLAKLPKELGNLIALRRLDLAHNKITKLPEWLGQLIALEHLDLEDNLLKELPESIGRLSVLKELDLFNNQLRALPYSLGNLNKLAYLFLEDNDGLCFPPEVLAKNSNPSEILDYYHRSHPRRSSEVGSIRELKMILIGRGEVGKSSLVDVFQRKPFIHGKPPTEGISISPWKVALPGGDATLQIWDFGGQEIMHGTHQFFLTRRSLYLVVVDGRHDRQNQDAEHWLKYVRALGGDSPVFVVMNKQGLGGCQAYDIDRQRLARKYGVPLDHFFRTDCADIITISTLREAILVQASEMLSLRALFPIEFMPIRERLGAMRENDEDFLSNNAYRQICRDLGVPEMRDGQDEYAIALKWLNDLGTVVSFPDDHRLDHLTVLNPEWVTSGIYRILNDTQLRERRHGELTPSELQRILQPEDRWPCQHHRYLTDLMRKFDLCFPIEGDDETLLVPELLADSEPPLPGWDPGQCLVIQYRYPLLPHGLLPRFITRTHNFSRMLPRWRNGVVLAREGAESVIRSDHDADTITIWVRGPHLPRRRALVTIVRDHFRIIHSRLDGLGVDEHVAIPGHPNETISYAALLDDEEDGRDTVRVSICGRRVDWPLTELLNGVESSEERQSRIARDNQRGRVLAADFHLHQQNNIYGAQRSVSLSMSNDNSKHISVTNRDAMTNVNIGIDQRVVESFDIKGQAPRVDVQATLRILQNYVNEMLTNPALEKPEEVAHDLKILTEEATKLEPRRKWLALSSEGLIEAAKTIGSIADPLIDTVKKLMILLGN